MWTALETPHWCTWERKKMKYTSSNEKARRFTHCHLFPCGHQPPCSLRLYWWVDRLTLQCHCDKAGPCLLPADIRSIVLCYVSVVPQVMFIWISIEIKSERFIMRRSVTFAKYVCVCVSMTMCVWWCVRNSFVTLTHTVVMESCVLLGGWLMYPILV